MPAGALRAAGVAGAVEVLPLQGAPPPDVAHDGLICWHRASSSAAGRGRLSRQFLATAFDEQGQGGGGDGGSGNGGNGEGSAGAEGGGKQPPGKTIEFMTSTGEKVLLSGASVPKCIASCKNAPELKDSNQSGVAGLMGAVQGGERAAVNHCVQFCYQAFQLQCFPGDSVCVVRNKGRVPLAQLRVGDMVLVVDLPAAGDGGTDGCVLRFDTVLAFLHHDPSAEGEVLQIRHSFGQVQLTPKHIIFSQRRRNGVAPVPVLAEEARVGDRLLTLWIDGSLTTSQILGVERTWKRGHYAPLLGGGTLLVDGAVVSCYAIPRNLADSEAFRRIVEAMDGNGGVHAAAHAVFLPLRLLCHAAAMRWPTLLGGGGGGPSGDAEAEASRLPAPPGSGGGRDASCGARAEAAAKACDTPEGIHPYAWVLYVVAASVLA